MGNCCLRPKDDSHIEVSSTKNELNENSCQTVNIIYFCFTLNLGKCGTCGNNVAITRSIEKKSFLVSGNGIALGSCALDCDVAYFEVKVGNNPFNTKIGLKRYSPKKPCNLSTTLDDETDKAQSPSFYFKPILDSLKKGDVVGIYWDQTDYPMLQFTLNGEFLIESSFSRITPAHDLYPAVSVKDSDCEFIFDENSFCFPPKNKKFKAIICATSLI